MRAKKGRASSRKRQAKGARRRTGSRRTQVDLQLWISDAKRLSPEAIKALFRASGWTEDIAHYTPAQIRKVFNQSHFVLSMWQGKQLVALASALSDGVLCGLVNNLVVHPEFRGRGLGTYLLHVLARRFAREGILCVYALGRRGGRARAFFARAGFQHLPWSVFVRPNR